jgi:hypothetical protein
MRHRPRADDKCRYRNSAAATGEQTAVAAIFLDIVSFLRNSNLFRIGKPGRSFTRVAAGFDIRI